VLIEPNQLRVLRLGTAAVWIVFGLVFKVLHVLPRHETIVASAIGPAWAAPVTIAIGVAEVAMGMWILSRRWPMLCATTQTAAIIGMNTVELLCARQHLLSPIGMVFANSIFLGLGWYLAVHTARQRVAS
jgi:hypothetical protein